jgi:hypothetical protein
MLEINDVTTRMQAERKKKRERKKLCLLGNITNGDRRHRDESRMEGCFAFYVLMSVYEDQMLL